MELWLEIPIELRFSAVALVLWLADWAATKTPNPLDNVVVKGLQWLWAKYALRNKPL